jgi:hypothetical protein
MKTFITIIAILTSISYTVGQTSYFTVKDKLSENELEVLKKVKEYHDDIKFTQDVTRHYILKDGNKELLKTTFDFDQDINGFYFEAYIYYHVELSSDMKTISYSYSAGTAASADGTINILGAVIRNEFGWGTSAGTVSIWVNDKQIYEQTEEF